MAGLTVSVVPVDRAARHAAGRELEQAVQGIFIGRGSHELAAACEQLVAGRPQTESR